MPIWNIVLTWNGYTYMIFHLILISNCPAYMEHSLSFQCAYGTPRNSIMPRYTEYLLILHSIPIESWWAIAMPQSDIQSDEIVTFLVISLKQWICGTKRSNSYSLCSENRCGIIKTIASMGKLFIVTKIYCDFLAIMKLQYYFSLSIFNKCFD